MSKDFKIGVKVVVLDEDLSGKITKIDNEVITIETDDGFLLNFNASELISDKSDKNIKQQLFTNTDLDSIIADKESVKKSKTKKVKVKERYQPTMEVDLHINQLVKSPKGMNNHEMLTLQLETAKRQLEFAIRKRIQKIVFIHGVGEGVLKVELEYLFGRYDVKYYDANYQKYGLGATEVYIYQNSKN